MLTICWSISNYVCNKHGVLMQIFIYFFHTMLYSELETEIRNEQLSVSK